MKIGIIAYGSLIDDPGFEIKELIKEQQKEITTPFRVEFAHKSTTRHGAPTLVPVENGGSQVKAKLLVLKENTVLDDAVDILFRREIHKVCEKVRYNPTPPNKENKVYVEKLKNCFGMDYALYTKILPDKSLTLDNLADLAIESAACNKCEDGISYLINVKKHGIHTPLSNDYEKKILEKTKSSSLEEARQKCWNNKCKD